ncbi:MAG: alpha/beta hydrolase [Clostridia bacterium]|nr:alpha/beta hydrolase [Clostridia bacterium]
MSENSKNMYENFLLHKDNDFNVGYHFPCEDPKAVLCIIHGIGEHAGRYGRVARELKKAGIACVAFDQRGHGITKGKRGDCAPRELVLGDVDALIERAQEFYPGVPIVLYGHSMGGNVCLDYRARGNMNHIPDKYIVSAPWIKLVKDIPKPVVSTVKAASHVFPTASISQSFPENQLGNLINVRPYNDDPLVHDKITLRCAAQCFDIGNAIYAGTNEDNGRAYGKPFLLMHGDEDKICDVRGSRQVAERLKDEPWFEYVEWPGYYHEIHNGGREATGDDVIEKMKEFILK